MITMPLSDAQASLADVVRQLVPGEEVIITENDRPVARLLAPEAPPNLKPRQSGTLRGTVLYMAPDFDAPLEDFREYMG